MDEEEYVQEYNVYERVGLEGDMLGEMGRGKEDPAFRDPTQRFYIFVDAISRQLKQQGIIVIAEGDIRHMLSKIETLQLPKYKNPTGYVLGYYVGNRGTINKKKFDSIKGRLNELEYPLQQADVIRYANLWITQLL